MKPLKRSQDVRMTHGKNDRDRLAALVELAQGHAAGFRNLEGLQCVREALEISRRLDDRLGTGRALCCATLCHFQRGDYVAAIATGLDAIDAYADGDPLGRSTALQSIALALFSVEAFDLAQSMAERALADARRGRDLGREAHAGSVLGAILADRGEFSRARHLFRVAAAHHRDNADVVRLKKATSNLGHTYRKQAAAQDREGHPAQARLYWTQALRIYRLALAAARHEADDAIILGSIAECECRTGRLQEGHRDVTRALELAHAVGDPAVLAHCRLWEGHILKAMGELGAAEHAFEQGCEAARSLEHEAILPTCLHELALVVQARGEAQRAAQIEERGRKARDERATLLARVRSELAPLWGRYAGLGRLGSADALDRLHA